MKKKRVRRWCFLYRNVPSLLYRGLGRGEMESAPIFLFLSFFVSFLSFFFFFSFFFITAIFYEYSAGASAKERVASLLSLPASQTLLKFCIEDYTNGLDECVGRLQRRRYYLRAWYGVYLSGLNLPSIDQVQ